MPRVHAVRDVFAAVRWMVKAGGPWRLLPGDFPPWQAVQPQAERRVRTGGFEAMSDLAPEQRAFNLTPASERVLVENVIRRLKVFRVLKETYRHRRRRHGLRVHLLAGLYNHDPKAK